MVVFHTDDTQFALATEKNGENENVEVRVNDDEDVAAGQSFGRNDDDVMSSGSNSPTRSVSFHHTAGNEDRQVPSYDDIEQTTGSSNHNCSNNSDWMSDASDDSVRGLFQRARRHINLGTFFRYIMYLYAERKLVVFFGIHFVSTMIIWGHFALIKFNTQIQNVPEDANRYLWKIIAPPLEFGSMHAILFQMTLIPITMSRFSIAALSESTIEKLFPLNRALRMHIHLGYTMITIVCLATIFFFIFFGLLCSDGEQGFCDRFTIEIMITGYSIMGSLVVIGITSYFRHQIPYEIFYAIHHMVFIMYFITIAHTIDNFQREGIASRSQTIKWFSSTLLFYFCDRAAMRLNRRYMTLVTSSSTVASDNGTSRMIVLKMKRPLLFRFKPGQYAFLQIGTIDKHWHPFSIASGPDSAHLEFYIEVQHDDDSWTGKLWNLLVQHQNCDITNGGSPSLRLFVDVMGPYGTSLAKVEDFSHVLAVGAGTGIVPILSLLKQHVRKMLQFDPEAFFKDQRHREEKLRNLTPAMEQQKGSLATKLFSSNGRRKTRNGDDEKIPIETKNDKLRRSIQQSLLLHDMIQTKVELQHNKADMDHQAYMATRSLYGIVFLALAPIIGILILGLNISWNTLPIEELFDGMAESIQGFTWLFQLVFIGVSFFIWDATTIWAYTDAAVALITPFADVYWFKKYEENGRLMSSAITLFSLLTGYMTLRLWIHAVQPRHKSWKTHLSSAADLSTLDRLEVVWTTRSASQVSRILPDLFYVWDSLVQAWGYENARQVCRVSIHVTDTDPVACNLLRLELEGTGLDVDFARLDVSAWIQNHTIDMIENRHSSYSLLAFCGSPQLAEEIHVQKISNDMLTAITGYKHHQMEFVSESYGGPSKKKQKKKSETSSRTRQGQGVVASTSSSGRTALPMPVRRPPASNQQTGRTRPRILSLSTRQYAAYDRPQDVNSQSLRFISPQSGRNNQKRRPRNNSSTGGGRGSREGDNYYYPGDHDDNISYCFEDAIA